MKILLYKRKFVIICNVISVDLLFPCFPTSNAEYLFFLILIFLLLITGTQQRSIHNFESHELADGILYIIEMILKIRRTFCFLC